MANLITEVFVSLDGLEFTKLDLHKDEAINMKFKIKDLQDISKIFSPYSLDFTFPASSTNRIAFGFFGDTDVIKINTDSRFTAKIYTDGVLNLQGFIQLKDISYQNNKPIDFTGSFSTSMTNLANRIGDDLITELTDDTVIIDWSPRNVWNLLQGAENTTVDGVPISYFVPLISSTRVWAFDANVEVSLKDNVAYHSTVSALSNGVIKPSELRPCFSFSTIIELIKKKYNLDVTAPLDLRKEYTKLVVWCNNSTIFTPKDSLLTIDFPFGDLYKYDTRDEGDIPDPKKYVATAFPSGDYFRVDTRNPPFNDDKHYDEFFTLKVRLDNVLITGQTDSPTVNLKVVRKDTDEVLISKQFDIQDYTISSGQLFDCDLQISDGLFIDSKIEFYILAQFNQPTSWNTCLYTVFFKYLDPKTGLFISSNKATYAYDSPFNNNSEIVGGTKIDLIKSLPEMKVIDFLKSYFKTFNISVFDTSPNDDRLYWLTPEDIQTSSLAYSKATLDYTKYLDSKEYKKSTPNDFNFYNFKHKTSEYRSNIDYLAAQGLEYGQAVFPEVKPSNPVEFVVETDFALMVPVILVGSNDIVTYYGFDGDPPEILETGESRYTPNYGELTIFYNNGNTLIDNVLGFQYATISGIILNAALNNYIKVLPFLEDLPDLAYVVPHGFSLAFSVLKWFNIEYPNSLYQRYYQAQTERLLDPNVLSQEFNLDLPSDEIYLNEATTIQGQGATPKGFRLQNDIIIMENLFTILDATIDYTTGKTKITLLNF